MFWKWVPALFIWRITDRTKVVECGWNPSDVSLFTARLTGSAKLQERNKDADKSCFSFFLGRPPSCKHESREEKLASGSRYLTTVVGKVTGFFPHPCARWFFPVSVQPSSVDCQTVAISENKSNQWAYQTHIWISSYCIQMTVPAVMFLLTWTETELDVTFRYCSSSR